VLRLVCILSVAVLAITAANTLARDVVSIAGKEISKQEKFDVIFEDKAAGHMISFTQIRAKMHETKGDGLFEALNKTCSATWDLTHGNGTAEGYCASEKNGDKIGIKWNGMCNSAAGTAKKPLLRCGGGWIFVQGTGTGRYAGVSGGGVWTGNFLPNGDFEEEWSGIYRK